MKTIKTPRLPRKTTKLRFIKRKDINHSYYVYTGKNVGPIGFINEQLNKYTGKSRYTFEPYNKKMVPGGYTIDQLEDITHKILGLMEKK